MLRIRTPGNRPTERGYVLDLILSEWLGLEFSVEPGPPGLTTIDLVGDPEGLSIVLPDVFFAMEEPLWLTEPSMPRVPLAFVPAPDAESAAVAAAFPVVYGTTVEGGGAWSRRSSVIDVAIDIFGSAFFLLTRYEEVVRGAGDRHGRFPASASIAAGQGMLDRPLVDEYVDLLWVAIAALWPHLKRRPGAFRLRLTHDVDQPWATLDQRPGALVHALAGDVLRRRDLGLALRRGRAILDARSGRVDRDPFDTFDLLMGVSERFGLRSTFYFMAGNEPGDHDFRYRIDHQLVLRLLDQIHGRGHEVGLHASYDSHRSAGRIAMEFDALRQACRKVGFDQDAWGVRQHYLRLRAPETWRHHEAAGFEHDSTLGYADASGFRAGTSREYPLFDVVDGRPLALRERPLIVMDATLLGYDALPLDAASNRAVAIVNASRRHGGDAVVLYHNSSLATATLRHHYVELVERLME
jgi:hypothetical protein